MKHSIEQLLAIVYRHFPRGIPYEDPRYSETEEARRLADARRAVDDAEKPWATMLDRLRARFPGWDVQNGGLVGACCNGAVFLPKAPGERLHLVGGLMSFLVPIHVVYACRVVELDPTTHGARAGTRTDTTVEASADEESYWTALSNEIASTFGCELLPPDVGRIHVPEVATERRQLGQATLYDCLVSDSFGLSGP